MRFYRINKLLVLALLLGSCVGLSAQENQVLSPYSAYGLGDLTPGMFPWQRTFGEMSLGVSDPFRHSPSTPSSYANLLKPVFSMGLRTVLVREETNAGTFERTNSQFMGLGFGMPINNGSWGVGFGLLPVSSVGYELVDRTFLTTGEQVDFEYTGSGGLSKMYAGLSKRLWQKRDTVNKTYDKLVLGGQMNYRFGTIENIRKAIYPQNEGYFNTNSTASTIIRDPQFDMSLQYLKYFKTGKGDNKRDIKLTAGAYYAPSSKLGARRTDLTTSYFLTTLGIEIVQDTIEFIDRSEGTITLPQSIGVGAGITINDKWTYAVEYRQQDWNKLEVNVEGWELPAELGTRTSLAAGVSFTPSTVLNPYGYTFLEKTTYSLAIRKEDDYLVINDSQLESYALSFGASFPLYFSKTRSRFTIGTELGTRGSTDNGGIKETYADFIFGVSITPDLRETWFKKRRIE